MIFVDTGYWIALFNPRDQLHSRALAWSLFVNERLISTDFILFECVNFFSMPIDRSKVHDLVP